MFYRKILLGVQQLCSTPCLVYRKTRLCGDEAIFFVQKEAFKLEKVLCLFCLFFGGFYVLKVGLGEKQHSYPALAVGLVCLSAGFWYNGRERYPVSFD